MKVACSRLGFLLLTWKVERQWRQLCCLGDGGVQQEKLLLQTNKFCGGWRQVVGRHEGFRRGSFEKSSAGSSMANSQSFQP